MSGDLHAELTRMLDRYEERLRTDAEHTKKAKDDHAQFLRGFAELRRDVVWPVFEAVGAMLAGRGHGVAIDEEEFSVDAAGKVREAEISLHIAPAGMSAQLHAGDHERSLLISTRHYNNTAWISAGRALDAGGIAGAKGAYPLAQIDRRLVEEAVLKFVGAVMAPA